MAKTSNTPGFFATYFPTFFGLGNIVTRALSPAVQKVSSALQRPVASASGSAVGRGSKAGRGASVASPNNLANLTDPGSSFHGSTATASPSNANFQRGTDRYGRIDGIQSDWSLYDDDPRLAVAVQMTALAAAKPGFWYTITPKPGTGARRATAVKNEIDAMMRRVGLIKRNGKVDRAKLVSWLMPAMVEGDLFIQRAVLDGKQLIGMEYMPAVTMERLSDNADQFPDVEHAFAQLDMTQNRANDTFALWEIDHHRWMRIGGDRYGQPWYKQTRQPGHSIRLEEEAQTIRRIDNSARREWHAVGNPDDDQDPDAIPEYEKAMGFSGENAKRSVNPYEQNTRYVTSGNVKVDILTSDPNVHEIDDLKWSAQKFAVGMHYPLQLAGYAVEGLSRDELEFIKEQWQNVLDYAGDFLQDIILNAIEFQILLLSEDPDAFDITLESTPLTTATLQDTVATIVKAMSGTIGAGMNALPCPLFTMEQVGHLLKQQGLPLDDIDEWKDALKDLLNKNDLDAESVHKRNELMQTGGKAGAVGVANGAANSKNGPNAKTGYGGDRPSGGKESGSGYKAVVK